MKKHNRWTDGWMRSLCPPTSTSHLFTSWSAKEEFWSDILHNQNHVTRLMRSSFTGHSTTYHECTCPSYSPSPSTQCRRTREWRRWASWQHCSPNQTQSWQYHGRSIFHWPCSSEGHQSHPSRSQIKESISVVNMVIQRLCHFTLLLHWHTNNKPYQKKSKI